MDKICASLLKWGYYSKRDRLKLFLGVNLKKFAYIDIKSYRDLIELLDVEVLTFTDFGKGYDRSGAMSYLVR